MSGTMSVRKRPIGSNTAPDSVAEWRAKRLRTAGLREELAERIAVDCRYDLHALLELVDRSCPGALAVRILAPMDARETPG